MTTSNLLKILPLFFIGLMAGFYFFTYEKAERLNTKTHTVCQEPLTYQIGSIDTQFGVSRLEVEEAMIAAATLWSEAFDRPVAIMTENAGITVSFIYDERQQLVDGELRFREQIESEQFRTEQLQREYDRSRDAFETRSSEYILLAERVKTELNELNSWVAIKNDEGGFTDASFAEFELKKEKIERNQQQVLRERQDLDRLASQINRDAERLNEKIDENNRLIDRYNEEYSGENRFTKASYQNSSEGGVITVNMFLNKKELVLILAHELGHAFGLGHVSNPGSVMHGLMGGQELFPVIQLTQEDREAVRNLCH